MTDLESKFPKPSVKVVFRCGDKVLYYKTTKGVRDIHGGHIEFGEKRGYTTFTRINSGNPAQILLRS